MQTIENLIKPYIINKEQQNKLESSIAQAKKELDKLNTIDQEEITLSQFREVDTLKNYIASKEAVLEQQYFSKCIKTGYDSLFHQVGHILAYYLSHSTALQEASTDLREYRNEESEVVYHKVFEEEFAKVLVDNQEIINEFNKMYSNRYTNEFEKFYPKPLTLFTLNNLEEYEEEKVLSGKIRKEEKRIPMIDTKKFPPNNLAQSIPITW